MELFDITGFLNGGIQTIIAITLGLLIATTIFTFLLWKNGEADQFYKLLGYLCGLIATVGGFIASIQFITGSSSVFIIWTTIAIFALIGGAGLRLFILIKDKWFAKEEKV